MANIGLTGYPKEVDPQTGWPPALLVPKVEGLPKGLDTTNEAENLLKTAVGWWDCSSGFKAGDRWLRNRGTGGDALDLRLGSSTTPNTNDPLFLEPDEQGYVYLPGIQGNHLLVPDSADLRITGDIDIRALVNLSDWSPSAGMDVIGKWASAQLSYGLTIEASGRLTFFWSQNGTATVRAASGFPAPTVDDGAPLWIRATLTVSSGEVNFYTSPATDGVNWSLFATVAGAGATSIYPSTAIVMVGGYIYNGPMGGRVYRAVIKNGINGTTVLDIDCDRIKDGATESFPAVTGQTVQIVRSSTGRKSVAMPAKRYGSRACMLLGTDDWMMTTSIASARLISGESATLLAVSRHFSVTPDYQGFICVGYNSKYIIRGYSSGQYEAYIGPVSGSGASTTNNLGNSYPFGSINTIAVTFTPDRQNYYTNGALVRTALYSGNRGSVYQINENDTIRVGLADNDARMTGEFTAAAVFRRALTQREVQLITDYYTKPLNANAYPVQAPDADRKSYLAAKLAIDPAHPVLDVMKDAVFAIDAKAYDGASNYVENLGWGGELLNPRMGSSAAADTNDPKWLAPEDKGYAYLPGIGNNFLMVPDENALDITGDIDIRAQLEWTTSYGTAIGKFYDNGTNKAYLLDIGGGFITLFWQPSGGGASVTRQSAAVPYAVGTRIWVRITLDVDDGAGNNVTKFYTSIDGTTWTQLGGATTVAGTVTMQSGTNPVLVGAWTPTFDNIPTKIYRAQIWSGIEGSGGTKVLDIDCDVITDGRQTSFLAVTGQLVTVNRSTSGRKTVLMPNTTVKVMDEANVYLPGVNGNFMSVPDEPALRITGDIDLRIKYAYDALTGNSWPLGKETNSYYLFIPVGGVPCLAWTGTDNIGRAVSTTAAIPYPPQTIFWLRATLDVDNGAGQCDVKFYTSLDGTTWAQLGATVTGTWGVANIKTNTSLFCLGSFNSTSSTNSAGRYYRAQVYNGIAGTKVLDIDTSLAVVGQSTFTAVTGQTVTINSTANSGLRVNAQKVGAGHATWLFGTDDYMEIQGALQHDLLNFKAGEDFTVMAAYRGWVTQPTGSVVAKKPDFSSTLGWALYTTSSGGSFKVADGVSAGGPSATSLVSGALAVVAGIRDSVLSKANFYTGTVITIGTDSVTGTLASVLPVRIVNDNTSDFGALELQSAMIFRRALTANEIATLTAFYESPGAVFNAAIPFNSPYVTFNG